MGMRPGEKAFIVGSTGSGKSYLMRKLLTGAPYVVVVDPKHDFSWSDSGRSRYDDVYESLEELREWEGPAPAIYRPDIADLRAGCDDFFKWAWDRRSVLVYVDELYDLVKDGASYWLMKAIKQGRSRKLTVYFGSQRPCWIPLDVVSEAKHFFVGNLLMPQDRKRMAEVAHPALKDTEVPGFKFFYVSSADRDGGRLIDANDLKIVRS